MSIESADGLDRFRSPDISGAVRHPGFRLSLLPGDSPSATKAQIGELVGDLLEAGAGWGIAVEVDTAAITRPGEQRGGAQGPEFWQVIIDSVREHTIDRIVTMIVDVMSGWLRRRGVTDEDGVHITIIYGPDGRELRRVVVRPEDGTLAK